MKTMITTNDPKVTANVMHEKMIEVVDIIQNEISKGNFGKGENHLREARDCMYTAMENIILAKIEL